MVLWENENFLTSNLLCFFTSVKLCPRVFFYFVQSWSNYRGIHLISQTFYLNILILGTVCDVLYECMLNSTATLRINQLLSYLIKSSWKNIKKWVDVQRTTVGLRFHAREKHYRCIVCFESVDGEVQRRSEGATLCVCGPRESLWQGAKRRGVILHEKVRENSTIYVWRQYNCTEVCGTVAKGGYEVAVGHNVVIGPNVAITYMGRRINS